MDWRWYITATAVKEYMALAGMPEADDGDDFCAAQEALGELSLTARLALDASERERNGSQIYRGKVTIRGKRRRIECTVMPPVRAEGPLPQLVRVRLK